MVYAAVMKLLRVVGWGSVVLTLVCATLACRTSRFPTCNSDAECAEREEGAQKRFCVNVRCVECRVDKDCKAGQVCNRRTNECEKL